jgi:putative polyhydroxyalkanoate system protein
MATISVEHAHTLGQDEALKRAHEVIQEFGERLKAEIEWTGTNATFKGTGFTGTAQVLPQNIAISVDLSMLLRPLKGKIESRLEKALEERFS